MKGLKYAELKTQDKAHLERQIAENRARMTTLAFQKVTGSLDNHAQITTLRRDIARMKTAIQEQGTANATPKKAALKKATAKKATAKKATK